MVGDQHISLLGGPVLQIDVGANSCILDHRSCFAGVTMGGFRAALLLSGCQAARLMGAARQ
jgi:hypothetical protein